MNLYRRVARGGWLALLVLMAAGLVACGETTPSKPAPEPDPTVDSVAGSYALDKAHYTKALIRDAEGAAHDVGQPDTLAERLKQARQRAAGIAAEKDIRLTLEADEARSFFLEDISGEVRGEIRGSWKLDGRDVVLEVTQVGNDAVVSRPDAKHPRATVQGRDLKMLPHGGIPFEHLLVRTAP